jgi:hypothetical protein
VTGRGWLGVGLGCRSSLTSPEALILRCYLIVQMGTEDGSPPKAGPR